MFVSPYRNCLLCPRKCGVDREAGHTGYCGETSVLRLAFAGIHRGEEPPITGSGGSGTVFVTGCNLGCNFCQNYQISRCGVGKAVSTDEFVHICMLLEEECAENINIVTGSHAAPALALGIDAARKKGLSIPVLWNSSGYESLQSIDILKDHVDVYLPDLKTLDPEISDRFFSAPNYPEHAKLAIIKMIENRKIIFDDKLTSGVMIRHLILPGFFENTRQVLSWFKENCTGNQISVVENRALLSLMTQYTPVNSLDDTSGMNSKNAKLDIPSRYVSENEYHNVLSLLEEFAIDEGYCQELVTGSEWLPDFTKQNPFSSELSKPVWHWKS